MRDIIAHYKRGHLVHATAATHRGEPMLIGEDAASAKQSKYDEERLERQKKLHAAQELQKVAEAEVERKKSAAAPTAAPAPATAPGSSAKVINHSRNPLSLHAPLP